MTTCDHGIALDRYCGDCELRTDAEWEAADNQYAVDTMRRNAGLAAAACLIGAVALVVIAAWWTRA